VYPGLIAVHSASVWLSTHIDDEPTLQQAPVGADVVVVVDIDPHETPAQLPAVHKPSKASQTISS